MSDMSVKNDEKIQVATSLEKESLSSSNPEPKPLNRLLPKASNASSKRPADDMINQGDESGEMKRVRNEQIHDQNDPRIPSNEHMKDITLSSSDRDINPTTTNEPAPAVVEDITNNQIEINSRGHMILCPGAKPGEVERWRAHRMTEDYINLCGDMMFPSINLAPFGYDVPSGQYPIESITALSILTSPLLRRPTVVEKWSPYEIAVFEAALALCGKHFHQVQKFIKTKNTKEVVEFYYIWKKTAHYKVWKKQYIAPEDDVDSEYDE